jgi:isoleucyl-tRNA synthetase
VLRPEDVEITSEDMPGWLVASEGKLTVALDVTVTEALRREGIARELVNRIQNLRKDSGFDVTDKVTVTLQRHPALAAAIADFKDFIASQTLAVAVELADEAPGGAPVEIDGITLQILVKKDV